MRMKNIFCRKLKRFEIDLNPFGKIKSKNFNTGAINIFQYPEVDKGLTALLNGLNIYISRAELFYIPQRCKLPIHIDLERFSSIVKLNWVIGNGEMVWWKPNNEKFKYETTPINTKYLLFEENDCTEIYKEQIGWPSLVNVGLPHSVDNSAYDTPRWCISHNIHCIATKRQLEWDEAVDRLDLLFEK